MRVGREPFGCRQHLPAGLLYHLERERFHGAASVRQGLEAGDRPLALFVRKVSEDSQGVGARGGETLPPKSMDGPSRSGPTVSRPSCSRTALSPPMPIDRVSKERIRVR